MTEQPKTKIDPGIYHSLCELLSCMNNEYNCMRDAADGLHKAATAMASASSAQQYAVTRLSSMLDRLEPANTFNPTEE